MKLYMPSLHDNAGRPLRILHVLNELRPSGAEVMLRVAAPYFQANSIFCEILSTGENSVGPYAQALKDAGYIIHHLPFSRSFRFFRSLRNFVQIGRYDIVHMHAEQASVWVAASVVPYARLVRTIHNNFTFTGWLRKRRQLTRTLSRLLGVRQLAISPSVQATEWKYFRNPTILCLNWYDSNHFRPPTEHERVAARKSLGLSSEELVLVSVGNCSPVKNHTAIIEALGRLCKDSHVVYLHAGHENDDHDERQLALSLELGSKIHFLGAFSDVRTLFHASDLFVMPSFYEGLPISLLEVLACGLPVLVAESPGLRDFRNWFPNMLFAAPTASDIAIKLDNFIQLSIADRQALAAGYADGARSKFGVEEGVARYVAVYRELTGKPPASRAVS